MSVTAGIFLAVAVVGISLLLTIALCAMVMFATSRRSA